MAAVRRISLGELLSRRGNTTRRRRTQRKKIKQQMAARKRRLERRLKRPQSSRARPVFAASNIDYELAEKTRGIAAGGIGLVQLLVGKLGMIVVRKNLTVAQGQQVLFADYRYFFYLTNDRDWTPAEVVLEANDRCDQENLNAQLQDPVRALRAPLDTLLANWAWMVMTGLAWNLKAWAALSLPEAPGRWQARHRAQKRRLITMEFKTFVNAFVQIPCQIIRTGRRLVYRLLAWNPWQPLFFRLVDCLRG